MCSHFSATPTKTMAFWTDGISQDRLILFDMLHRAGKCTNQKLLCWLFRHLSTVSFPRSGIPFSWLDYSPAKWATYFIALPSLHQRSKWAFEGCILALFRHLAATQTQFIFQDILNVDYASVVSIGTSGFVTGLCLYHNQNVYSAGCLSDSVVCTHTIAIYVPRTSAFGKDTHRPISSVFLDEFCKAKGARKKGSRPAHTKFCVQIHSHLKHTTAADVFETFRNAQIVSFVVPTNSDNHEIFLLCA